MSSQRQKTTIIWVSMRFSGWWLGYLNANESHGFLSTFFPRQQLGLNTNLRIDALNALSRIEDLNTNELEKISALAKEPKREITVSMYAAGILCNFVSTKQSGVELLIRLWKSYPFSIAHARPAFKNIEKCGDDPTVIDMLMKMAADTKLGTIERVDACRTIIHIKKRD